MFKNLFAIFKHALKLITYLRIENVFLKYIVSYKDTREEEENETYNYRENNRRI